MRSRRLLLGHRGAGATKTIPENTIASFEASLSSGCDRFEFDMHHTSDGRAVTCDDAQIKGQSVALADASQCETCDLDDVLRQFSTTAFLDIQLKVKGLEQIVCEAVLATKPLRGYVVSSFQPGILETCKYRNQYRIAHWVDCRPTVAVVSVEGIADSVCDFPFLADNERAGRRGS